LFANALVFLPINIELLVIVFAVTPSAINLPADSPNAILLSPVVLDDKAFCPITVLLLPVVLFSKEL
jgi:hypothetical protein